MRGPVLLTPTGQAGQEPRDQGQNTAIKILRSTYQGRLLKEVSQYRVDATESTWLIM